MTTTEDQLFAYLDRLGIVHHTIRHHAVFTVEDGRELHKTIPGLHGKNLFIKDKKDQLWLVAMPGDKRADLNRLEKRLKAPRFTFAKAELLQEVLGLTPGSVTPFGLMNDTARRVRVVLDQDLMQSEWVNFHPLINTASTTLKAVDLLKFIETLGYHPTICECGSGDEVSLSGLVSG